VRRRIVSALIASLAGAVAPHLLAGNLPGSYTVVHGWPELPDGFTFGEVSAVAVDSHNRVCVSHHGSDGKNLDHPIMCFDGATGKVVAAWGEGLSVHGLAVDSHDDLWLVSAKQHQVYKYSQKGELLLTIGAKDVPGEDGQHFNQPTAVAVTPDGYIYVSDGYGNSRIAKFSPKGEFLLAWGRRGTGPGEFNVPHGIAVDAQGRVFVADRNNHRIQVFDANGKFLYQIKSDEWGLPWAIAISRDGYLFATDGGETIQVRPAHAGVVKMDLEGKVLDRFGKLGQYDGQFYWPHGIAVSPNGEVYVTDIHVGRRVQKFAAK
jgi:peptidylamidoglycolate lyase